MKINISFPSHLCSDNSTSLVLFNLFHNKFSPLSFLCSHMFGFNCSGKLPPKCQASDRYIIQCNIEIGCPLSQNLSYFPTDSLPSKTIKSINTCRNPKWETKEHQQTIIHQEHISKGLRLALFEKDVKPMMKTGIRLCSLPFSE